MTPSSLFAAGSITETVFEKRSGVKTRSWLVIGTSGALARPGTWPALAAKEKRARARKVLVMSVIPESQFHDFDLLLLRDNDLLGEASQALVLAVAKLGERHVDRALVVRDHHPREVAVRIARVGYVHRRVHPRGRLVHHLPEPIRGGRGGERAAKDSARHRAPRPSCLPVDHGRPFYRERDVWWISCGASAAPTRVLRPRPAGRRRRRFPIPARPGRGSTRRCG